VTAVRTPASTQRERREATIGKLLEATIDTLSEVGYAGASTSVIARRAGVSQGGMFRHFASRTDLMVAAAERVAERHLDVFKARSSELAGADDPLVIALTLARDACRAPINTVWHELLLAARTDEELRGKLQPALRRFYERIDAIADQADLGRSYPPEVRRTLVRMILNVFDGEALVRAVQDRPEEERQLMALLTEVLRARETTAPS
jgi:AcrR family transcriptional regulator